MNAILGYERSIVWREPGTTRDVLTATTAIDGWPIEFIDTAGLRDVGRAVPATDTIEAEGIARAHDQIAAADLVILVADTTASWDDLHYQEINSTTHRPLLIVHNKCDLSPPLPDGRPEGIETTALNGNGLDVLCQAVASALVPIPPLPGHAVPFTTFQIARLQGAQRELNDGNPLAACEQLQMTDYN
jgi:tRNA modification GTPase